MKNFNCFKLLKITIYIVIGLFIFGLVYSNNKFLIILGFISLSFVVIYDLFKRYKNEGKISWLEAILDILCIIP